MRFVTVLLLGLCALSACAGPPQKPAHAATKEAGRAPRFEDAFGDDVTLVVLVRPRALLRDKVYGPLLRRASDLASAKAGVAALGATALVAIERSDEVIIARGAGDQDAVVALVGVPADLDPTSLIDTDGRTLWRTAAELRPGVLELAAEAASTRASLFVLPSRTWVIAVGDAAPRAREAFATPPAHIHAIEPIGDDLARMDLLGEVLRQKDPSLQDGALAPVGRTLLRASVSLLPGADGVIVAKLSYGGVPDATAAETRAAEVVAAFRRKVQGALVAPPKGTDGAATAPKVDGLSWLAAAGVAREGSAVIIRAPLPHPWLEALAKPELDAAAPPEPAKKAQTPANAAGSL